LTAAVILLVYTAAMAAGGTWWLPRAVWPLRTPRLGIAIWQALSLTVAGSAILAGMLLAGLCLEIGTSPGPVEVGVSLAALRAGYATAGGVAAGVAGGALALMVAGRLAWFTAWGLACAARRRARHDDTLALVAHPGPAPGLFLLDDDHPAVYCLPGRRRIVLTTGALRRLDTRQLDAVLAHERAHLAGRHHLVLGFAAAFSGAFPRIPLFAVAAEQISSLVEMAADDAAGRRAHRLTLAGALLTLAAARVPAGALGAAGTAAAQRIRRLAESPDTASKSRRAATSAAALVAASAFMLSAPVLAVLSIPHCPTDTTHPPAVVSAEQAPQLHQAVPRWAKKSRTRP
jgi:Zn-dependent protease with chaperone function